MKGLIGVFAPLQDCMEDSLNEVALTHGWKDSAEDVGITEVKENSLTLLLPSAQLWEPTQVKSYRQSLWQHLRHLQQMERGNSLSSQVRGPRTLRCI
jgi:hypothetical protein